MSTHPRTIAAALMAACLAGHASHATEAPPLPGPAAGPHRRALAGREVRSAECASCHAEIAREWQGSLHAGAWSDPLFQKGYAQERQAFCRGCHAPEADPAREPSAAAQAEGVGCVTCHVLRGAEAWAQASARALHAVETDTRLAGAAACAGCHEFAFPPGSNQRVPLLMQRTVQEWRSSSFGGTACQDCHLPLVDTAGGGRHRSHAFRTRAPEVLRSAVRITARRADPLVLELTLEALGAGHAFPTGDLFRRLEVRAEILDERGAAVAAARPVHLTRSFLDAPAQPESRTDLTLTRLERADTRVGPPGTPGARRRVELTLPTAAEGKRVRWEVAYQRVVAPTGARLGQTVAEDEIVIEHGLVDPGGGAR